MKLSKRDITIGEQPTWWRIKRVGISRDQVLKHAHLIGVSGSGKSRYLAHLYEQIRGAGYGATLIDPHGDLAKLVAGRTGDTLLSIPREAEAGRYLRLNVLDHDRDPYTVSRDILESMHRAWPSLGGGVAPRFDKLILNGVKLLHSGRQQLTALEQVLTDRTLRASLLRTERDDNVRRFWQWYDKLPERLRIDYADSALSRIVLLTFSPVLRHSLGSPTLSLNPRRTMDRGEGLIVDLSLPDGEARRLLGSLLTVMYEQAALGRGDNRTPHFLIVDEFAEFSAQSEEAFARILSQCRKFGLYLVMAHQTWSQASERLRGALQNVGIEIAFRLGRDDAVREAQLLGKVSFEEIKHTVTEGEERSHPIFYSLPEQWEKWVQRLQSLPDRHYLLRASETGQIQEFTSPTIDDPISTSEELTGQSEAFFYKVTPDTTPEPQKATPAIKRRQPI